jgi:uncharacterized protein with GYD domain
MPMYLYQGSYSSEAMKAMITSPSDRKAAAAKMVEGVGGKLHHLFFAFGSTDVYALIEAPDDRAMAAGAMIVASTGVFSSASTTRLIPAEEAMEAMKLAGKAAGTYKPPMG